MFGFRNLSLILVAAAGLGLARPAHAAPVPNDIPKPVDIVLCLDISGSMNGLIDSAKLKLWDIVNELAKMKPTPILRVGLYSYGGTNADYKAEIGWVKKEVDLTGDLDEVYAKLNGLKINGGTELVARVTQAALKEQKWSDKTDALRLIFVCGNEPANQDKDVELSDVSKLAKEKGVYLNTIYCGSDTHPEAKGWKDFAIASNGKYMNIDQNKAKKSVISTPFDKEIAELSSKLNTTYVAYGKDAAKKSENQKAQDTNAGGASTPAAPNAAAAERGLSKAGGLYRNSDWCLVDRLKYDPKFDIKTIKEEDLPEDLKKLKPEERLPYLKKKLEEREGIQKQIAELGVKRGKHIEEETKKQPKSEGEKALDEAFRSTIREQAKEKGFEVQEKK